MACDRDKAIVPTKMLQVSNLESFIKKTLGGSGEGLKIETLANTIVNKFYGSKLFSDTAMEENKEEGKWKVGMQVLILSKSKDRWIRGFVKCLETEGYVTVAYADRVKTVHPDSESIRSANIPSGSSAIKRSPESSDEIKLEFDQTSVSNYFSPRPQFKLDKFNRGNRNRNCDVQCEPEYKEKQFLEIMQVLVKNLVPDEEAETDGQTTLTVATPRDSNSSRGTLRALSCPTQMRDEIVQRLNKIQKQHTVADCKRCKNSNLPCLTTPSKNQKKVKKSVDKKALDGIKESEAEVKLQKDGGSQDDLDTRLHLSSSFNVICVEDSKASSKGIIEERFITDKVGKNHNSSDAKSKRQRSWKLMPPDLDIENQAIDHINFGRMSRQSYVAKILVIGDSNSGKTSIIRRYIWKTFSTTQNATVGIEHEPICVEVGGQKLQLIFWDIAGQERFIGLAQTYCRNAAAALIVFDATENLRKLDNTAKWKFEVDRKVFYPNEEPIPVVLFANKWDLIESGEKSPIISKDLLDIYCRKQSFAGWFPTSAKTGSNISKGIDFLVSMIIRNKDKHNLVSEPMQGGITLTTDDPVSLHEGGCCG